MFGKLLENKMKEKGIRVKDLSILADITEGYISDLKKEKSVPRRDKLEAILNNIPLSKEEKEELYEAWERDSSPYSFVKKYDNLVEENKHLKELISDKEENLSLIDQLKVQKKLTEKIENQKNRYKLYMELFAMLEEDDRKYMLKQILRNIECDMREKGIYAENKKEIDRLKKEIENGIEYDF
ncbi:helix-turn-helix transcriptional regulator [Fusobacterium perfoetens]|uniref:helix-turn-helix domain-containing protein n=1 Tax=Fusobacterium perfoetens TaxID=852 RepID=UPI0026EE5A69|nr:helix-turn-helix transcriptional regulator [Fusobacterium perfoetens]